MIAFVATFHGDIINIAFYGLAYMLMEDHIHGPLICRTSVLQAEGHYCVAEYSQRHPEGCVFFIFRVHLYLIVLWYPLKTARIVNQNLWSEEKIRLLDKRHLDRSSRCKFRSFYSSWEHELCWPPYQDVVLPLRNQSLWASCLLIRLLPWSRDRTVAVVIWLAWRPDWCWDDA